MCKKYEVGGGKAATQLILTQLAKSLLQLLPLHLPLHLPLPLLLKPLLLPTLLLLKPLRLLLTSQMAALGLTQRLRSLGPIGPGCLGLGPGCLGPGPRCHGLGSGSTSSWIKKCGLAMWLWLGPGPAWSWAGLVPVPS